jgi:hypothetical protein
MKRSGQLDGEILDKMELINKMIFNNVIRWIFYLLKNNQNLNISNFATTKEPIINLLIRNYASIIKT